MTKACFHIIFEIKRYSSESEIFFLSSRVFFNSDLKICIFENLAMSFFSSEFLEYLSHQLRYRYCRTLTEWHILAQKFNVFVEFSNFLSVVLDGRGHFYTVLIYLERRASYKNIGKYLHFKVEICGIFHYYNILSTKFYMRQFCELCELNLFTVTKLCLINPKKYVIYDLFSWYLRFIFSMS